MATRRAAGRIRPHERDTNDDAPILGETIEVLAHHSSSVRQTEQKDLNLKSKRDHRNRLKHIYEFWQAEYPEYYNVGVRALSDEELSDEDKFWWKNKHDIVYEGINVKMVKAFLAHKKIKSNGKMCSHVQLRKYNDAILFGAKKARTRLPRLFYEEIETYLNSFKKETRAAKRDGNLDEQEADPISWALFQEMLRWALEQGNIFLWVFSLLQWHCMARSINIGSLGLHCFRVGDDHLVVKYDKSKVDQAGETSQTRNRRVRQRTTGSTAAVAAAAGGQRTNTEEADGEEELPDLRDSLSARARARGLEIQEQVADEMAAETRQTQQESRRLRRIGIPGGDGTTIHLGPTFDL